VVSDVSSTPTSESTRPRAGTKEVGGGDDGLGFLAAGAEDMVKDF
jgi:hypothetical protein